MTTLIPAVRINIVSDGRGGILAEPEQAYIYRDNQVIRWEIINPDIVPPDTIPEIRFDPDHGIQGETSPPAPSPWPSATAISAP